VRDLLNLIFISDSAKAYAPFPFAGDRDCFFFIKLFIVVSSTLFLLFFVILSRSSAFFDYSALI
jgi:hypothetical protein